MPDPFAVDDIRDERQARAHAALAAVFDLALTEFRGTVVRDTTLARVQLVHLVQATEYLGHGWHFLEPGTFVLARAPLTSGILRAMTDLYARHLDLARAPDPDERVGAIVAESLRQERLAFEAAGQDGADVDQALQAIDQQTATLPQPRAIVVANTLEAAAEFEMLTVYRFESAHVHTGEAARRARTRPLVKTAGITVDVHLEPPSLCRVGQLTWAALGVWRRMASFLCAELDLAPTVLQLSIDAEPDTRAAAERPRRDTEPLSPPYHAFDFPLWSQT